MPITAFSDAWAAAFRDAVNTNDAYSDAGKSWTNPVALVVEPFTGAPAGAAVQVELVAGHCLGAAALAPEAVTAPFVLTADVETWKSIVMGSTDPIMAVARGKVKLTRGALGTLMLHAKAAKALVTCAHDISTDWP